MLPAGFGTNPGLRSDKQEREHIAGEVSSVHVELV